MPRKNRLPVFADKDQYTEIPASEVPDGMSWKPRKGRPNQSYTILYSFANVYKLVRKLDTGAVQYFKLKGAPEKSPAAKIDAEPEKGPQVRYRKGTACWLVENGKWFCVEVVDRTGANRETWGEPARITIRPITGWDAERTTQWPYGDLLEFPSVPSNALFKRLRPLRARVR